MKYRMGKSPHSGPGGENVGNCVQPLDLHHPGRATKRVTKWGRVWENQRTSCASQRRFHVDDSTLPGSRRGSRRSQRRAPAAEVVLSRTVLWPRKRSRVTNRARRSRVMSARIFESRPGKRLARKLLEQERDRRRPCRAGRARPASRRRSRFRPQEWSARIRLRLFCFSDGSRPPRTKLRSKPWHAKKF